MDRSASQVTVSKEKTSDLTDLSGICLSDLSDLSADRWADYPDLAPSCDRRPKPATNGRAPALGPPGDSLDDFR
jgi:hypothetical protein